MALVAILAIGVGGARLAHRSIFRHAAGGSVASSTASVTSSDSQVAPSATITGQATSASDSSAAAGPPPPPFVSVRPTTTATAKAPDGRNIVASSFGGEIVSVSGAFGGPGVTGEALIDGSGSQTWQPDTGYTSASGSPSVIYPHDIIFTFYKRDTALVSAVAISYALETGKGPGAVEVWTTTDTSPTGFRQVAAARLADSVPLQAVSFTPVEARYVKVRIDSGATDQLYMSQVRIIEASRPGYTSLLERHPDILAWGTSVRHAAQRGIDWLEPAAMKWQHENKCYGCHVQAQTMMGLAVAQQNNYLVSAPTLRALVDFTRSEQNADGHEEDHGQGNQLTPTHFAAMGWSYYDDVTGIKVDSTLLRYVDWMLSHVDSTGEFEQDFTEPPIAQGEISATSNAVLGFMEAYTQTGNAKYKAAADKSVAFLTPDTTRTTQDEVFKIIALERYGTPAQRQIASNLVQQLQGEQDKDGGWRDSAAAAASDAFATGQVLYAFKEAGVSVQSTSFSKGVHYLIANQDTAGSWGANDNKRPSAFAPTMWAVIGLAGTVEPPSTDSLKAALDRYGRVVLYINFDFNKATLRPDARPIIAQVLALLQKYPDLNLTINGHTDNVGTHDYNVKLSRDRAAAVVAALVSAHVKPDRLSSGGFGPDDPIADNSTEKGRAKNRRVELVKE